MINYTTPTITLTVEGVDISTYNVYVSLEQGKINITKTGDDLFKTSIEKRNRVDTKVSFSLTQEESAAFDYNKTVSVQLNWIDETGVRAATEIKTLRVMRNLLDQVITYEEPGQ